MLEGSRNHLPTFVRVFQQDTPAVSVREYSEQCVENRGKHLVEIRFTTQAAGDIDDGFEFYFRLNIQSAESAACTAANQRAHDFGFVFFFV